MNKRPSGPRGPVFCHCVSSDVLDGQVKALVPQFERRLRVSLLAVSQAISEAQRKGFMSFLTQSHSVNTNSWSMCDWFQDDCL